MDEVGRSDDRRAAVPPSADMSKSGASTGNRILGTLVVVIVAFGGAAATGIAMAFAGYDAHNSYRSFDATPGVVVIVVLVAVGVLLLRRIWRDSGK